MLKFKNTNNVLTPVSSDAKKYINGKEVVYFKEAGDIRTLKQNAYLWVCFKTIGEHLGYDKDEAKYFVLTYINFTKITQGKIGGEIIFPKPTHNLSKKDFSELTERIIRFAGEHGIEILTPEEYYET